MHSVKKTVFYLSLGLNIVAIVLFLVFLTRRGGTSYLLRQITSIDNVTVDNSTARANTEDREVSNNRNNSRRGSYQMRNNLLANMPDLQNEIIFLGDSLTEQGEWSELLREVRAIDRGISGDTTDGILKRIGEIIELKPAKIFLLIGINDTFDKEKSNDDIIANYRQILATFSEKIPETKVYVQSILPIDNVDFKVDIDPERIVILNQKIRQLATEYNYNYIDLYSSFVDPEGLLKNIYTGDGIHLTAAGYLLWADKIELLIKK